MRLHPFTESGEVAAAIDNTTGDRSRRWLRRLRAELTASRSSASKAPPWLVDLAKQVAVFAAYFVAGRIGLAVPFTSGNVSPVWPPAGLALASILLLGYRVWPAIAAAAFLVNFLTSIPAAGAFGIAIGNTTGPLASAYLLRRWGRFRRPALMCLRDVLAFVLFAVMGGTAISASVGTLTLFLTHVNAWSSATNAWLIWWLGDAMGVLIVAPLVLTLPDLRTTIAGSHLVDGRRTRSELLELAILLAVTVASCALVFGRPPGLGPARDILVLALFAFVMWAATRFNVAATAAVTFVIALMAVWDTAHGLGLFVDGTRLRNATLLQSFLSVVGVSGLSVSALIAERTRLVGERAEREAERRGEARYREITDTANEGVWMIDSRLLTCFVNRRMTEMLGYSAEEMLGQPVTAFMFEEDRAAKAAELERRRRGVSERVENRYRRRDGTELWVRVSTSASVDDQGRFAGALAMVSDITEFKRHEAEGKRSRDAILLLSRAVEQTADSVVVTDKTGRIEYVNPAFESTTGYDWDEAVGQTPAILKSGHHGPDFYASLWDNLLAGRPFRGTLVNRKKNGELYWAEQTITPIKNDEGDITHFVSVLKDVTELRRKHEQEVQLRLAREVQQRFYRAPLVLPEFDCAAASYPAAETGGDYFDFIPAHADTMYVAIGDASGHGLGSALVMALTRAYVRAFAAMNLDVGEILARVNRMLLCDLEENHFVTLLLTRIDPASRALTYSNAGHVPGFIVDDGGETALTSTGPPLGMFIEPTYPSCELTLPVSDSLVLVTDGVVESAAGEDMIFGTDRVVQYVREHSGESARALADGICDAARRFGGFEFQSDDITTVVVRPSSH